LTAQATARQSLLFLQHQLADEGDSFTSILSQAGRENRSWRGGGAVLNSVLLEK
jgi:hypothetical protein